MDEMMHDAKQAKKARRSRPKCYHTIDMFTGEVADPPKRSERSTIRERDAALIRVFAAKHPSGTTEAQLVASAAGSGLSTGGASISFGKLKKLGMISVDPRRGGMSTLYVLTELAWLWIRRDNEKDEPARSAPSKPAGATRDPSQADAFPEAA